MFIFLLLSFFPNLVTCPFRYASQHSFIQQHLLTVKDESTHFLQMLWSQTTSIFLNCCSCCVTGQHNTFTSQCYLPSSTCMCSETPTDGCVIDSRESTPSLPLFFRFLGSWWQMDLASSGFKLVIFLGYKPFLCPLYSWEERKINEPPARVSLYCTYS